MLTIHKESHTDHGLKDSHIAFLLGRYRDQVGFKVESIELPTDLPTIMSGLYGPAAGDSPIDECEVLRYRRGTRAWASRMIRRPMRCTRTLTVVMGPADIACLNCGGCGRYTGIFPAPPLGEVCGSCVGGKVHFDTVLYTAYAGPAAPQEPGDLELQLAKVQAEGRDTAQLQEKLVQSLLFWAEHALSDWSES